MSNNKSKSHQIVLLDREGYVHFSCNSLFDTNVYKKDLLTRDFPFLESIFPSLIKMDKKGEALRYSKMVNPFKHLKGAYDFSFKWFDSPDGEFILWTIYDYTEIYKNIQMSQQKRNEMELTREKIENRNKLQGQ